MTTRRGAGGRGGRAAAMAPSVRRARWRQGHPSHGSRHGRREPSASGATYLAGVGPAPHHERPDAASLSLGVLESMSPHRPDPPRAPAAAGWCRRPMSGELLRLRLVDAAGPPLGRGRDDRRRRGRARQVDGARPVDPPPPRPPSRRRCVGVVRAGRRGRRPPRRRHRAGARRAARRLRRRRRGRQRPALDVTAGGVPRHRRRPRAARARRSAVQLLADVVRALPAHAHLVLAGRTMPALPLARLRAAERVLDVTQESLAFTGRRGRRRRRARSGGDVAGLDGLGGWPALVRLAIGSPGPPTADRTPGAGSSSGRRSSAGSVPTTCGRCWRWRRWARPTPTPSAALCGAPVDVDELVRAVPMVAHTGDGRVRAHDLWHGTLTLDRARRRGPGDGPGGGRAPPGRRLVRPGRIAGRPPRRRRRPVRGVAGARPQHALGPARGHRDGLAAGRAGAPPPAPRAAPARRRDAARPGRPRPRGRRARWRRRSRRSVPAATTSASRPRSGSGSCSPTPGATRPPRSASSTRPPACPGSTRTARCGCSARWSRPSAPTSSATSSGAPTCSTTSASTGLPPVIAEAILRFRWHLLVFSGRAEDAARLAPRVLAAAATPNAPLFRPVARWLAGDPTGFDGLEPDGLIEHEARTPSGGWENGRDWFNYGVFTAMVWASSGDREVVARVAAARALARPRRRQRPQRRAARRHRRRRRRPRPRRRPGGSTRSPRSSSGSR